MPDPDKTTEMGYNISMNTQTPSRILHVAMTGDDAHDGSESRPLRHIQTAADRAMPGDTVRVHGGVYRERIDPPRGGLSEARRITYEAAGGERVEITGTEPVTDWIPDPEHGPAFWKAQVPNSFFGDFHPYTKLISGDWFIDMGRPHHLGGLLMNDSPMREATDPRHLITPWQRYWHAEVGDEITTFRIHCGKDDPNDATIEVFARPAVFYPRREGVDFITLRGFILRGAATNWAPPTAEQPGLVGTHWSRGWIIEQNTISHSRCVGVSLGKHGDAYDNTSQDSAEGYVDTIRRALDRGWTRERIGGHIVRHNTISHCGQAGIAGSLGAIFSVIAHNEIHHIHHDNLGNTFNGAEQAGIKFHAPIDTLIEGNHIHHTHRALWMDWMAQGTRITRNLCHDNTTEDLFLEVNHGPFIVDHNLFLSPTALLDWSEGGAFAHNLFAGRMRRASELQRETPWHPQSSTELAGLAPIRGGDEHWTHNLFLNGQALAGVEKEVQPWRAELPEDEGRVCSNKSRPYPNHLSHNSVSPAAFVFDSKEGTLRGVPCAADLPACPVADTRDFGPNRVAGLPYLGPDGKPLHFNTDFLGRGRREGDSLPGPFAADSLTDPIVVKSPRASRKLPPPNCT